jgi:hypothetical protein
MQLDVEVLEVGLNGERADFGFVCHLGIVIALW